MSRSLFIHYSVITVLLATADGLGNYALYIPIEGVSTVKPFLAPNPTFDDKYFTVLLSTVKRFAVLLSNAKALCSFALDSKALCSLTVQSKALLTLGVKCVVV